MKRIAIIGTSCSGKTTFARQLSTKLGYPHIELDTLFWGQNWTRRDDFIKDVRASIQNDEWIMDGYYRSVRDLIWRRATSVIILNMPFYLVFSRSIFRTLRRILTKEKLFNQNVETFREAFFAADGIPMWVVKTHLKRNREYNELMRFEKFSHVDFIELKSTKAITHFLNHIKSA